MNVPQSTYSAQTQSIGLAGIGNARELGGYKTTAGKTVRRGVLLRSAAPEGATEEDRRKLEQDYRLSRVLDFRMEMERQMLGNSARGLDFASTHRIGIMDENYFTNLWKQAGIPFEQLMAMSTTKLIMLAIDEGVIDNTMYVGYLEDDCGKRGFAEVFERLLAQPKDEALLFHCTQGKDRTGLAAMLILSTLGIDEQTIIFDYLLTNTFNAELIEQERKLLMDEGVPKERVDSYMFGLDKVFEQTMQNALDHLNDAYGSVWGYVHDTLGVSDTAREELRAKYLV